LKMGLCGKKTQRAAGCCSSSSSRDRQQQEQPLRRWHDEPSRVHCVVTSLGSPRGHVLAQARGLDARMAVAIAAPSTSPSTHLCTPGTWHKRPHLYSLDHTCNTHWAPRHKRDASAPSKAALIKELPRSACDTHTGCASASHSARTRSLHTSPLLRYHCRHASRCTSGMKLWVHKTPWSAVACPPL
jgi:hypothetical protein